MTIKKWHRKLVTDPNYDLTDRDMSEKIWLWRHRQQSDGGISRGRRAGAMSQTEAAEKLQIGPLQYHKLESGEATMMSASDLARLRAWMTRIEINDRAATNSELCYLARRRSGMTVKEVANDLGVSIQTFGKLEIQGAEQLMRYWRGKGYWFTEAEAEAVAAAARSHKLERPSQQLRRPSA